ncbi:uncharacterized protein [Choristoneura fumiferana]|uniref:uncharacterized protein n=1 Tax=Choristoneura fumiferana TaxID=7141 RepID=UPI003D15D858
MLKAYLVPVNCQLLSPPLLNGEKSPASNQTTPTNTYKASTPTGKLEWSASCIYTVEDDGSRRTTTSSSTIIPTEEACTALSTTSTGTPSGEELPACSGSAINNLQNTTSSEPPAYPGCRHLLRQAFQQRGLPENSLEVMLSSLAQDTLKNAASSTVKSILHVNLLIISSDETFTKLSSDIT